MTTFTDELDARIEVLRVQKESIDTRLSELRGIRDLWAKSAPAPEVVKPKRGPKPGSKRGKKGDAPSSFVEQLKAAE